MNVQPQVFQLLWSMFADGLPVNPELPQPFPGGQPLLWDLLLQVAFDLNPKEGCYVRHFRQSHFSFGVLYHNCQLTKYAQSLSPTIPRDCMRGMCGASPPIKSGFGISIMRAYTLFASLQTDYHDNVDKYWKAYFNQIRGAS